MGKVRVEMDDAGCRALLNSAGVQAEVLRRAQAVAAAASGRASFGTYEADVRPGRKRATAMAKAIDKAAALDNARNNTLAKSIDAGRG